MKKFAWTKCRKIIFVFYVGVEFFQLSVQFSRFVFLDFQSYALSFAPRLLPHVNVVIDIIIIIVIIIITVFIVVVIVIIIVNFFVVIIVLVVVAIAVNIIYILFLLSLYS